MTMKTDQGSIKTRELLNAAKRGDAAAVRSLLKSGIHPDARGKGNTSTALEISAALGHLDVVRTLLKAGADVNIQDRRGHDALGFAVKGGFTEIVELLLAAGASVKTGLLNFDILAVAASMGHEGILKALLDAGASVRGDGGRQALFWAIQSKHEATALMLIKAEVKLDSVGMAKQMVLAARNGMAEVVRSMLERGVDPSIRDQFGKTAIEAARKNKHSKVIQVLTQHRVPKDSGRSLIKAATDGNVERLKRLLQTGADIETRDANGSTALLRAIEKSRHEAVRILLEAGASPDNGMPNADRMRRFKTDSESPVSLASSLGDLKSVELLLKHRANLNRESCEKTACHCLMYGGPQYLAVVDRLLDSGLNPNSRMIYPLVHFAKTAKGPPKIRERIMAKLQKV